MEISDRYIEQGRGGLSGSAANKSLERGGRTKCARSEAARVGDRRRSLQEIIRG